MSDQITTTPTNRLAPGEEELIDRERHFEFQFNGTRYVAHPGDTIASALAAAGVKVFSRSFKYHRPRGLLCCSGHCPNCLVQVGDEPNVRACMRVVEPGMQVSPQNAWPSLEMDVLSLTELAGRFLPVGFYYKTFIRPKFLWPMYESVLRNAAGLGEVHQGTASDTFDKAYLHGDVAVVGGGIAGLSAALSAAEQGARVLLFDENPSLGGHARFVRNEGGAQLADMRQRVRDEPNITEYPETTVLGWYEENWMSAVRGNRLYKIRAKAVIVATGAYEQPLVFDNSDLPGVMLGSAVQRLMHLYGVVPGVKAVVVTANDDGWELAANLVEGGVTLMGVVDERPGNLSPLAADLVEQGIPVFKDHTLLSARGSGRVESAAIVPVRGSQSIDDSARKRLDCDLIAVSVGWTPANGLLYQAGAQVVYNETREEFLHISLPPGVYAAGRVSGTHDLENRIVEGQMAGLDAAAYLGLCQGPTKEDRALLGERKVGEQKRTSARVTVAGRGKHFVCLCEDVTEKDIKTSIEEGYNTMELLKRYSTISMGPCQGKMCQYNTIHLCARENGWGVNEMGTTTARPPMRPVKLGNLAGQNMEPVKYTPLHDWHLEHGAKMMVAGLWMRPEHYGDPASEVRAVRERVGLIDVSTLGKLRMTGPGVPDLLDRIYVNKWQKLGVGRVRYGVMCNDEGIVLDDGVTAHIEEDVYYTTTTSSGATAIYEWVQWWMQSGWGEGVHVTPITENRAAFNLAGPKSRAVLRSLTEADISNEAFPYMHVHSIEIAGVPCLVFRIGFTGELSYEIHPPAGYGRYLWERLMESGEAFGIAPFGVEAQRVLRLEKAHIIVGQDTDALSDPISADMEWVVKLDKADFLGLRPLKQVADERPEQRLVGFKMAQPELVPEEGNQIVRTGEDGSMEIIGWVTSSRFSATLNHAIGLCWLPAEVAEQAGAAFTIRVRGELQEARVHHGPFYDPDGDRLRM